MLALEDLFHIVAPRAHGNFSLSILAVLQFLQCFKSDPSGSLRWMAGPMSDAPRNLPEPPPICPHVSTLLYLSMFPPYCVSSLLRSPLFLHKKIPPPKEARKLRSYACPKLRPPDRPNNPPSYEAPVARNVLSFQFDILDSNDMWLRLPGSEWS